MSQSTYLAGISCLCCGKTLGVTTEIDKDPLTLGAEMKLKYIAIERFMITRLPKVLVSRALFVMSATTTGLGIYFSHFCRK